MSIMSVTEASIQEWEDQLPPWVIRKAITGLYEVGNTLPTKDGRRVGNAHIIQVAIGCLGTGRQHYTVLTDAGTRMILCSSELVEFFHPPKYVCDVNEVIRKFDRNHECMCSVDS